MSVSINANDAELLNMYEAFTEAGGVSIPSGDSEITVFPGFCDVHVHFREPGFLYKESILTGSMAAAHGGFTSVCTMPNLDPVPDSVDNIKKQIDIIRRDAAVNVYPYASITINEAGRELSDMDALSKYSVAFSDDGHGVEDEEIMLAAMEKAASLNKIIAAHCEFKELTRGGYIHDGKYAAKNGHRGIPSESEYREVERDIRLAKKTGCALHICHVSAKESVELIRQAKKEGVNVSCETAPHYLLMDDSCLKDEGRFK